MQRLTLESWFKYLEQTPLTDSSKTENDLMTTDGVTNDIYTLIANKIKT